jgi:type IV pilus assembly protein PilO
MRLGLRELVFVILMLGLLGACYFFVFKPAGERRAAREVEINDKRRTLNDLRQSMESISDLGRKIDDLQKAITFFESKLPQEREIDKILKELWPMAQANQLQTRTIKTLKAERSSGYSELPIEMSLSGDFKGYYAFLLQLERLPRLTRLSNMKLDKITHRDGEMQAKLTMSIFFEADTNRNRVAGVQ